MARQVTAGVAEILATYHQVYDLIWRVINRLAAGCLK